jgi:LPS-assembly lipoprotein
MWWHENRAAGGRFGRLVIVLAVASLTAGCFQPMYGEHSLSGGPGLRETLGTVDVAQIDAPKGTSEARIAVELRNALLFQLTGGPVPTSPTHRLTVKLAATRQQVIVDLTSARPDVENYGLDASYTLTELATNKPVVTATTFARVSYDIPGQVQRFARIRGLRDAESRAAKVIADQIQSRLASYFVAGT